MTTSHRVTQVPTVRRGDLAIIESASRTYYVGAPTETSTRFELGTVASVTREGAIKSVRRLGSAASVKPTPVERLNGTVLYVSAETVDVHGILAEATRHTYAGSDMPRPYDSLAEIKALCRAYRR